MAEKVLVISTFPPKGSLYNHPSSAVAGYTKNTLLHANADNVFSFVILADILENSEQYEEDEFSVSRCWKRNSLSLYFNLLSEISKNKDTKKILFAFEWAMFGAKKWLMAFLPLFLLLLKIKGKKVYFVSHGVLLNAQLVSVQMGVKSNSLTAKFWTFGLRFLYWSITLLSKRVVVFEEYLRKGLLKLINKPEKIITIPHGVVSAEGNNSKAVVKKKKNEFIVESFGFLIWYKGSDFLVSAMANYFEGHPESNIKLIMVGGATKTYKDLAYQKYVSSIYDIADKSGGKIEVTGFIEESKIADYYRMADLLVLPYRVLVSGSGPLSLVFTYKRPFLISDNLKGYIQSADFSDALGQAGLKIEDITFSLGNDDLSSKIEQVSNNPKILDKIKNFSELMYEKRNWVQIGRKYERLLQDEKID